MARSLNRVQLIGNLTRDPELRYTPNGTAVCTFSVATNRGWTTDTGEKKEGVEFHRIVSWNKLAEICSQFLTKGRKVFVEGRLATRSWTAQDGTQKQTTEIVISDMILLDNRRTEGGEASAKQNSEEEIQEVSEKKPSAKQSLKKGAKEEATQKAQEESEEAAPDEEIAADDIPF
ncbi:MAG: single-stranded DNA-binding protein [Candidatus Levybacteria bacterium CG10_big_fil_rev_8_21_14_0_10_35_13]|nr:MAG: single-stranded DNA-binding protein [Candidatus Levybacteria bacterium CG10_big_fil_rev_8_21_14_0_10_35_13]